MQAKPVRGRKLPVSYGAGPRVILHRNLKDHSMWAFGVERTVYLAFLLLVLVLKGAVLLYSIQSTQA